MQHIHRTFHNNYANFSFNYWHLCLYLGCTKSIDIIVAFIFVFFIIFILFLCFLWLHKYVCVWLTYLAPMEVTTVYRYPGILIIEFCMLPCGWWNSNMGSVLISYILLVAHPLFTLQLSLFLGKSYIYFIILVLWFSISCFILFQISFLIKKILNRIN